MAGKWIDLWDETTGAWRRVYFETWPEPVTTGTGTPSNEPKKTVTIYGSDNKPLDLEKKKKIGF
jgi:hypothetical protein